MTKESKKPAIPPENIKGMIQYPCCPSQTAVVARDAHGQIFVRCPGCGKFLLLDNDRMTAEIAGPCRGAAARFKAAESA